MERWELHYGERLFYFQNNRPALEAAGSGKVVKWVLIKGLEYITKPEDAALWLTDVWEQIEFLSIGKKVPTFQEVSNKR